MRKCLARWILLANCWIVVSVCSGQNMLWQRSIGWPDYDLLTSVVDLEDGTYLACGSSYRAREPNNPRNIPSVVACRFTAWGDTIYCVNTGLYLNEEQARLLRTSSGKVYLTGFNRNFFERNRLAEIDPETGLLLWWRDLQGAGNRGVSYTTLIEGPDRSLILAGSTADTTGQATLVGYLARYDTLGNLVWATYLREHPSYTLLNHVEMTPQGTILASGTAGSRIWATEFTEDGSELRRATFYATPTRIIFDWAACVRQAPGDRYVVSGNTQASRIRRYLGLHQGWAGPAVWGFERQEFDCQLKPQVNQDGSVVYMTSIDPLFTLSRRRADSSMAWSVDLTSTIGQNGADLSAFAYLADSSAVAVGRAFFPSTQLDFYLARITNVGVPYRPWSPVTATKPKTSQPAPRPYPNPCTYALHFTGLAGPATLTLHDATGRSVLQTILQPGQAAEVGALPPGVYGYVLEGPGKVWRGRVVKR